MEADSPNGLNLAVVTVCVFMSHIFVHFVIEFKKFCLIMFADAVAADVKVGDFLGLIPFAFGLNLGVALITPQVQLPLIVSLS